MTLPDFLSPSPRVAPRLRYVVDLPAGYDARALVQMALIRVREVLAATPDGSMRRALLLLASGRVEEVQP